jgi:hypothetical protein
MFAAARSGSSFPFRTQKRQWEQSAGGSLPRLEQANDAAIWAEINRVCRRDLWQSGHGHDLTADRDNEFGSR